MRKLILIMTILFSFQLSAGDPKRQDDKYCGKLEDGRMTVVYHGVAITTDVKLDDGTILKPDGNMLRPDGSTTTLRDGECIGKDGKPGNKEKSEKPK